MQQKRTRTTRPKLFQCSGYGDCSMIFTRSEHLVRHSRKHTGEKPFVCVIPECTKAFSRFDNMMQHTQTHRNNGNSIVTKDQQGRDTRSNTRAQAKCGGKSKIRKAACEAQELPRTPIINNVLYVQTQPSINTQSGLVSPISLSSPQKHYTYTSSSSEEEDDEDLLIDSPPNKKSRRLSVADLCNPINGHPTCSDTSFVHNLTKDEFEALEGFGRFRHAPSVFSDSSKDLAFQAQQ